MKIGDIVMVFGNPVNLTYPIGQATLIKKTGEKCGKIEHWEVEYLDDPGHTYAALIRNPEFNEVKEHM